MEKRMIFKTTGTCTTIIEIEVVDRIITKCVFTDGCMINPHSPARSVVGENIENVILRFEGDRCGSRRTSCLDQLAQALKMYKADLGKEN